MTMMRLANWPDVRRMRVTRPPERSTKSQPIAQNEPKASCKDFDNDAGIIGLAECEQPALHHRSGAITKLGRGFGKTNPTANCKNSDADSLSTNFADFRVA
jgi:hypothetical protein